MYLRCLCVSRLERKPICRNKWSALAQSRIRACAYTALACALRTGNTLIYRFASDPYICNRDRAWLCRVEIACIFLRYRKTGFSFCYTFTLIKLGSQPKNHFVCLTIFERKGENWLRFKSITPDGRFHYSSRKHTYIYFDPLKPHFYIVKLGFTRVYIIFLISAQKHRLWVLVRTASARRF